MDNLELLLSKNDISIILQSLETMSLPVREAPIVLRIIENIQTQISQKGPQLPQTESQPI